MRTTNSEVLARVREEFPDAELWDAAWWPFAEDGLGNSWVVDVERGEVFERDHAEGRGEPLASSFAQFLSEFVASLESGERVVDPKLGIIRRELLAAHGSGGGPGRRSEMPIAILIVAVCEGAALVLWLLTR